MKLDLGLTYYYRKNSQCTGEESDKKENTQRPPVSAACVHLCHGKWKIFQKAPQRKRWVPFLLRGMPKKLAPRIKPTAEFSTTLSFISLSFQKQKKESKLSSPQKNELA